MTTNIPPENLARRYSRYYIYIEPVVSDPLVRGYFSFVASLLLIAFFLIFALSPTINTILSLRKKIDEQQKTVTALSEKINNIVAAQDNYAAVANLLPLLSTALPAKPEPQVVILELSQAASASALTLTSLQFNDIPFSADTIKAAAVAKTDKDLGLIPLNFSFATNGSVDNVHQFLLKSENLPRQIRFSALSVAKKKEGPGVNVNVTAAGYYLPNNL